MEGQPRDGLQWIIESRIEGGRTARPGGVVMTTNSNSNGHKAFNPSDHLMQLQGKDYLAVQWRLVWFREKCPDGTIETSLELLDLDRETEDTVMVWNEQLKRKEKVIKKANGLAIFKAVIHDGKGGVATGTKMEKAASFPDWLEKAETGAIGRALAGLGFGTQFAPELDEGHRIVDSPVKR